MIVVVCLVAIVAAANAVWWLAGLALFGALIIGTAQWMAEEQRWAEAAAAAERQRRLRRYREMQR